MKKNKKQPSKSKAFARVTGAATAAAPVTKVEEKVTEAKAGKQLDERSHSKLITANWPVLSIVVVVIAAGALYATYRKPSNTETAPTPTSTPTVAESPVPTPTSQTTSDKWYSTAAVKGDSITTLYRRIITDYAKDRSVSLDGGQKVYIETKLVQAHYRDINPGDTAGVAASELTKFANESSKLSPAQRANWSTYARRAGVK